MFLVIRVRGTTGVNRDIAETLKMLRLTRINHAVLIEENPSFNGMLQKAKDYITWGEIDSETLVKIIAKRGRIVGGDKITDEYLLENSDYSSIDELANGLLNSEIKAQDIDMKPVFRLHPPRKGYESIRLSFNEGGSLGFRGDLIKDLAKKMI
ncbi:50S ribosomal protein L30 [Methanobrevibacter filiformis]|uniref:Large ribosomal subunit protein uL30 n=1 Tax=Methanobrevibacter filiformis TaxID=55758 RepID=A0A165ZHM6_9EURY|nr:50S ribosomal protein L30 [Methanobrevibacter filiformis]KZX10742.1 50S ribosomal protein L30 [Methanobrevibacter filiformis]